jgi:hypothetical protein
LRRLNCREEVVHMGLIIRLGLTKDRRYRNLTNRLMGLMTQPIAARGGRGCVCGVRGHGRHDDRKNKNAHKSRQQP